MTPTFHANYEYLNLRLARFFLLLIQSPDQLSKGTPLGSHLLQQDQKQLIEPYLSIQQHQAVSFLFVLYLMLFPSLTLSGVTLLCHSCLFPQDIPKTSLRCSQDIPKKPPRCHQEILKISPRFPQDFPKISQRCLQDIPRYPQDIPKISSRYPKDISKIFPKYQ